LIPGSAEFFEAFTVARTKGQTASDALTDYCGMIAKAGASFTVEVERGLLEGARDLAAVLDSEFRNFGMIFYQDVSP
jgi:hypothetical protein